MSPAASRRKAKIQRKSGKSSRRPAWLWWAGGIAIAAVYIFVFYYFFVGPTGFRWRAIYGGESSYPDCEGYEMHGIDISHYQGAIDWKRLRKALIRNDGPVRFVIIKSTEGATMIDSNFERNFYNARDYGFVRGAYHFFGIRSSARSQAYHFLDKVKLEAGDLPPVLDVEHKNPNMSTADFQREVLLWLHIVEDRYHVKPIIYTNYKFKETYLSDARFDRYPYWIAHYYVKKMGYKGQWRFWQYTDVGRVDGIRGYVDLNIYNGSYYDLKQFTIPDEEDDE